MSRELRRNRLAHDRDYDADLAHARARERPRRPRRTRLAVDAGLRAAVQAKLELEWEPGADRRVAAVGLPLLVAGHVCHETIYHADQPVAHRATAARAAPPPRPAPMRYVIPSKLIDQRPPEVEDRARLDDWEGDLIISRGGHSAVGTLVERRIGLLRLIALPDGHSAERLCAAIAPVLDALPEPARRTLAWD